MSNLKFIETNEKIAEKVVDGYKRIENAVVNGYEKIENSAVDGYTKIENKFVAKAGSNAIGKNFIQLGGVFTDEKFRGQGLAQILIKELCKTIRNMNKEPVLFVQVKNESAKRAYRKVGFVYQSDYTICYYNW